MNGFIDLHTHILPGVDDGAENMVQSLQLLRMAWEDGTRAVVMTPHYRGKSKKYTPGMLRERFADLQKKAAEGCPGISLYLGQELLYQHSVPDELHEGKALTLNGGPYVLLEFLPNVLSSQIIKGVSEIIYCGFIPIVAHIERYTVSQRDTEMIDEVLRMGALLQLNADSVMGVNGLGVKRLCQRLLSEEKIHFIASDAHNTHRRTPQLRQCFLQVHKKYGKEYAARLFYENALAVIENRIIE